jgi:hypothetical protein
VNLIKVAIALSIFCLFISKSLILANDDAFDNDPRREAMGSDFYYWKAVAGHFQDRVIISAHGGISAKAAADLTVPAGLTLHYYVIHGVIQGDFGLTAFAAPTPPVPLAPIIAGGQNTYNYDLSKYQGRHGNVNETYASIIAGGDNASRHNAMLDTLTPEDIARVGGNVTGRQSLYDIVTVRNRWWSRGSDLKSALKKIRALRGNSLVTVECFFCRSFY